MKILSENIKYRNQREGFTITEVVVAALIFAIATAGVLATATSMRKPAVESSEDVTAAFLAKRILDDLRSQLDAVTWNQTGGPFDTTTGTPPGNHLLNSITVGTTIYKPSYIVEVDPDGTQGRKIDLRVDW